MNVVCIYDRHPRLGPLLQAVVEFPNDVDVKTVVRHWRGSLGLDPDTPMETVESPVTTWEELKHVFTPYSDRYPGCSADDPVCVHGHPWGSNDCSFCDGKNNPKTQGE
jgi:hypothetical protein